MSTIDTSTWNPDADFNVEIEGIPLNADAGIAQTWKVIAILMAAMKGDTDAIKAMISVMEGATASADGASGLVPKPEAGDQDKVLKGDGTWGTVAAANHVHGNITSDGKLGTAFRVVMTDGNKAIDVSSITTTKLGYLIDVTANIQAQLDGKIEEHDLCNWQKTNKAGSVTFKPVPESNLEPVVDFIFIETPPVSGNKSPDNPSTITGVSSVTVTHCESRGVNETEYIVNFGGTYYGGFVDLSTGTMTVTWGGVAISSFSSAYTNTNTITCATSTPFRHKGNVGATYFSSNRFVSMTGTSDIEHVRQTGSVSSGASGLNFYIAKTRLDVSGATDPSSPTDAEWLSAANTWLSENPVFFVGELFSPQTVQLTPTQILSLAQTDKYMPRVNTLYTDAQAVQVGYQRFFDEKRLATLEARIEALEALHA